MKIEDLSTWLFEQSPKYLEMRADIRRLNDELAVLHYSYSRLVLGTRRALDLYPQPRRAAAGAVGRR